MSILTQSPVTIDLSRPAMQHILYALSWHQPKNGSVECEVDNFRNLLQNLLERSEPEPGNLDLIGG